MTIFVIEKWSDSQKRWLPTGNVRRTYAEAVKTLKLFDTLNGARQITRYSKSIEQKPTSTRKKPA